MQTKARDISAANSTDGRPEHQFGNGWLYRFKERFNLYVESYKYEEVYHKEEPLCVVVGLCGAVATCFQHIAFCEQLLLR